MTPFPNARGCSPQNLRRLVLLHIRPGYKRQPCRLWQHSWKRLHLQLQMPQIQTKNNANWKYWTHSGPNAKPVAGFVFFSADSFTLAGSNLYVFELKNEFNTPALTNKLRYPAPFLFMLALCVLYHPKASRATMGSPETLLSSTRLLGSPLPLPTS